MENKTRVEVEKAANETMMMCGGNTSAEKAFYKLGFIAGAKWASQPVEGKDLKNDPFIKKHLDRIWEKMKEAKIEMYIKPLFNSLTAASVKYFLETGTVNGGFRDSLNAMMDSIRNWQPNPQPVENNSAVWVKASERLPDSPDFWMASNIPQDGKAVHCRVNGVLGFGYFGRLDNKLHFWYNYFKRVGASANYPDNWQSCDGYVEYNNFHLIEWLDENSGASQPTIDSIRVQAAKDRHNLEEMTADRDYWKALAEKCIADHPRIVGGL